MNFILWNMSFWYAMTVLLPMELCGLIKYDKEKDKGSLIYDSINNKNFERK